MAQRMTAFAYSPGASFLHRMSAGVKLLGLLAISVSPLVFGRNALIAVTLAIAALALPAGIKPARLLSGSRMLLWSAAAVILVKSVKTAEPWFSPEGFFDGLVFAWTMLTAFSATALFFSVTTMAQLRKSLAKVDRGGRAALALSLMLGFIPRFFALWEESVTACAARAGKPGFRRFSRLVLPAVERMLEAAADTARAMESRGL